MKYLFFILIMALFWSSLATAQQQPPSHSVLTVALPKKVYNPGTYSLPKVSLPKQFNEIGLNIARTDLTDSKTTFRITIVGITDGVSYSCGAQGIGGFNLSAKTWVMCPMLGRAKEITGSLQILNAPFNAAVEVIIQ